MHLSPYRSNIALTMLATAAAVAACSSFEAGATQHLPAWGWRVATAAWLTWAYRAKKELTASCWRPQQPYACVSSILFGSWLVLLIRGLFSQAPFALAVQPAITLALGLATYIIMAHAPTWIAQSSLQASVVLGCSHTAYALWQRIQEGGRASGGFFSPNDFSAFVGPMALWCLFDSSPTRCKKRNPSDLRRQALRYASAAFLTAGVWASASRAGLIAIAVGYLAWAWQGQRQGLGYKRAAITMPALAAIFATAGRFGAHAEPYNYGRLFIWKACIAALKQHGFGQGFGSTALVLRHQGVRLAGWVHYPCSAQDAHSEFLQAAIELGWLGLGGALLAPLALFGAVLRRPPSQRYKTATVGFAIMLAAATSQVLHVPCVATWVALWCASLRSSAAPPVRDRYQGSIVKPAALILAWLAVISATPTAMSAYCNLRAKHAYKNSDLAEAHRWLVRAIGWAPYLAGPHLRLLELERARGLAEKDSLARLLRLSEMFPHEPALPAQAALLATKLSPTRNVFLGIKGLWEAAATRDPHNAFMWLNAARAAQNAGEQKEALALVTRALTQEPHCAQALALRAELEPQASKACALWAEAVQSAAHAPHERHYARAVLTLDDAAEKTGERLRCSPATIR